MRKTPHALILAIVAATLAGCSAPKAHTTFLSSVDLVDMTDRMAESFTHDDVISARTPNNAPWVISFDKVVNHTNQLIPEREKWLFVARLRALLAQSDVGKAHHLIWVVPPDEWKRVADELANPNEPLELRMKPTHELTADFNTLTNTSGAGRSDAYFCAYKLFNLETGTLVWSGSWEVKRAQSGKTYD